MQHSVDNHKTDKFVEFPAETSGVLFDGGGAQDDFPGIPGQGEREHICRFVLSPPLPVYLSRFLFINQGDREGISFPQNVILDILKFFLHSRKILLAYFAQFAELFLHFPFFQILQGALFDL